MRRGQHQRIARLLRGQRPLHHARTWYDALLRLPWKHYGTPETLPKHFTQLVDTDKYDGMLPARYERLLGDAGRSGAQRSTNIGVTASHGRLVMCVHCPDVECQVAARG